MHPDVPAKSVPELVAYARTHPDKLSYATGTLGEYMAAAQFLKATGISSVRVPYKGGAQLMPDLVAGRVQLNFGPVSSGLQHAKDGKLRMLAVLLTQRSAVAPDVPTLAEAGVASLSLPSWQALFAPPKTPGEIADRLSRDVARVLRDPALRAQFDQQALQVEGSAPEALAAVVTRDAEAWRTFVRENDIPQE
jgi:tripartite-type tricarboxylate transporter receptor subunit TctC